MKPPCCFILPKTVVTGIAAAALAAANVQAAEAPNCEENPGAASCAAPWAATGQDDACKDTPGWANGVTGCSDRGFKEADGCSVKGWTCAKYRQSWCADGKAMKGMEFAIGEDFNSPEINCCSCGGGKRRPAAGHDQIDVGKASSERAELQSFPKCEQSAPAAFSNCDHFGGELAGHTLRSCEDMSKLLGGFEQCAENGYTVEQGCVKDVGFSCWAYEMMSYCKHGKALAGMEWSQGEGFSFPEKNCCVCGGGKVSKAASA